MSTKIYNKWKVSIPASEVIKHLVETRKVVLGFVTAIVAEDVLKTAFEIYDLNLPKHKDKDFDDICQMVYKELLDKKPSEEWWFRVGYLPHEETSIISINSSHGEMTKKFLELHKEWIGEDYHYQNQTDQPDDVSDEEWEKRGDFYDVIFKDYWSSTEVMFHYDYFLISTAHPSFSWLLRSANVDEIKPFAYSDERRRKILMRDKVVKEITDKWKGENPDEEIQFSTIINATFEYSKNYESGLYKDELEKIELKEIEKSYVINFIKKLNE